ncbi:MAG TPA: YggS family pyridoxal phosphate-dependent enzyme [Thermomicrobiaceae bacterium]|nr:YggS family pyridoxal phosphate-dependent enzyme [Thermomicrobiaceae bacterium]
MVEGETRAAVALAERLAAVRERVALAAEQSGREPESVRIVGVSKTVGRDAVDEAFRAGLLDFGENRVQDALRKFDPPLADDVTLHLIGYLQTNKARDAVSLFHVVHSLDRVALADALQQRAEAAGKVLTVLLQVNIAGEAQKHGAMPEDAAALLQHTLSLENLRVAGLMTIAPLVQGAEEARPVFRGLRELRDDLQQHAGMALPELSMGMTNDFVVAIAEGATMVRVGRAIFGG